MQVSACQGKLMVQTKKIVLFYIVFVLTVDGIGYQYRCPPITPWVHKRTIEATQWLGDDSVDNKLI